MRILLVGSNPQENLALKANLEREFLVVDLATGAEDALRLARTVEFDLIIMNDGLPETCVEIRMRGGTAPVLILSQECHPGQVVALLQAGADDCVRKPYSFEELLARISALLRRPRQILAEELRVGNVTLNTTKHTVTKQGQEVSLTRKEFMLLEYLMRNSGNVVSRGQILEHVWDINADPFSNTIESHILSLRKKIEGNSLAGKLIRTVSGRGYKIHYPG